MGSNLTKEEGKQDQGRADSATSYQSVALWEQKAELEHTNRDVQMSGSKEAVGS